MRNVLDAAEAASGSPAHGPLARQMRLQFLARQRDCDPPAVFGPLDLDAANVLDPPGDPLAQREAIGKVADSTGKTTATIAGLGSVLPTGEPNRWIRMVGGYEEKLLVRRDTTH